MFLYQAEIMFKSGLRKVRIGGGEYPYPPALWVYTGDNGYRQVELPPSGVVTVRENRKNIRLEFPAEAASEIRTALAKGQENYKASEEAYFAELKRVRENSPPASQKPAQDNGGDTYKAKYHLGYYGTLSDPFMDDTSW